MTRSFLRNLGIEPELLEKIIDAHGEGINREKDKLDAAKLEITALKENVVNVEAEFEQYKQGNKQDEYKQKYEDEMAAHKATRESYQSEKTATEIDTMVSAALKAAGMNESVILKALKLYDRAIVERDGDTIKNADKVMEHFKGEWADFFGTVKTESAPVGKPTGAEVTPKFNYTEALLGKASS